MPMIETADLAVFQVLARSEIIPLKSEGSSLNSPAVDQCTIPRLHWCIMLTLIQVGLMFVALWFRT